MYIAIKQQPNFEIGVQMTVNLKPVPKLYDCSCLDREILEMKVPFHHLITCSYKSEIFHCFFLGPYTSQILSGFYKGSSIYKIMK